MGSQIAEWSKSSLRSIPGPVVSSNPAVAKKIINLFNPPVIEASREIANLTERKNQHTPVYGVKEFVCLSVCDKL